MKEKKRRQCGRDRRGNLRPCWALDEIGLGDVMFGDHVRGLRPLGVMNLRTGTTRFLGVTYNKSAADKGVALNFCPWCGREVTWKAKAAPVAERSKRR